MLFTSDELFWFLLASNCAAWIALFYYFIKDKIKEKKRIKKLNKQVDNILQFKPRETKTLPYRDDMINELSRYVLVYDRKLRKWVKRRQID